jgi:zinc transport system substrate-binding protein
MVVVSIRPIHSLVAGVMAGVGVPFLIVQGAGSPHTYSLRPSAARAIQAAEVVFWVGPQLESFLVKPLRNLSRQARVMELSVLPGLTLYPVRSGGAWEPDADEPHGSTTSDPHLWLDPVNARKVVQAIVAVLGEVDPANTPRYHANGQRLSNQLDALDKELRQRLRPLSHIPYLVFHDGYQYLERRYGLRAIGSVTVDPELRPGVRRIESIRRRMREIGAVCVFSEPEFEPSLVQTIIEGTEVRTGVLDPLGADLQEGPELYGNLMLRLAANLRDCLSNR